jgi:hypothetical protein
MITATLDTKAWDQAVRELIAAGSKGFAGTEVDKVFKQSVGLVARDAYKLTPPMGKAPTTETLSAQRKVGREATARDINRVFISVPEVIAAAKRQSPRLGAIMAKLAARGQYARMLSLLRGASEETFQVRSYIRKGRPVRGYTARRPMEGMKGYSGVVSFSAQPNKAEHDRRRDNRGRVRHDRPSQLVTGPGAISRYIRQREKQVGSAKSGWSKALKTFDRPSASWTRQHQAQGVGKSEVGNGKSIHTIANLVRFIQPTGEDLRIMQRAIRNQVGNLQKRTAATIKSFVKKLGW